MMLERIRPIFSDYHRYPATALRHRPALARAIAAKEVTNSNLQASLDYLKKVGPADFNEAEFRSECGLGVVVSQEDIVKAVADLLKEKRDELLEKRYAVDFRALPYHSTTPMLLHFSRSSSPHPFLPHSTHFYNS